MRKRILDQIEEGKHIIPEQKLKLLMGDIQNAPLDHLKSMIVHQDIQMPEAFYCLIHTVFCKAGIF